ncbi:hypothetical protein AAG570_005615 [Ranatra chinensis]|uniref:RRM domain-containing protein n=1 Tax=Ranatra chinensis TaxID=642074 RepID=A0ABD0YLJ2_9HEMI
MASKRRNMFHKNKTQETKENDILKRLDDCDKVVRLEAIDCIQCLYRELSCCLKNSQVPDDIVDNGLLEFVYTTLLIHLDDQNPDFQLLVLGLEGVRMVSMIVYHAIGPGFDSLRGWPWLEARLTSGPSGVYQLKQRKHFEVGQTYISVSEKIRGESRLTEFLDVTHEIECGEHHTKNTSASSSNVPQTSYINDIHFSRQDTEAALAVKPNSLETKLLRFALTNQLAHNRHRYPCVNLPGDPINRLKDLESQILADPIRLSKKYRNKRKKILEESHCIQKADNKPVEIRSGDSLWDVVEFKKVTNPTEEQKQQRVYTCSKETLYTIEDGKIVACSEEDKNSGVAEDNRKPSVTFVSAERMERVELNSKSDSEISQIKRFSDYERGNPSNVLYIKNLPKNMSEDEFTEIVAKAKENCSIDSEVTYRLLSGKMRGQAFVTFKSVKDATKVLECMNGSEVRGRPMVIQFGRKGGASN